MLKVVGFSVTLILKSKKNVLIIFVNHLSERRVSVLSGLSAPRGALLVHCSSAAALRFGYCTLVCIALNTEFRNPGWSHAYSVPCNSDQPI